MRMRWIWSTGLASTQCWTPSWALSNVLELVARPHGRVARPVSRLRLRRIEIDFDLDVVGGKKSCQVRKGSGARVRRYSMLSSRSHAKVAAMSSPRNAIWSSAPRRGDGIVLTSMTCKIGLPSEA
jgi:hypothetical protein